MRILVNSLPMQPIQCLKTGRNCLGAGLFLSLLVVGCLVMELAAQAAGLVTTLTPVADTFVRSQSRDSRKNYGTESTIDIRSSVKDGVSEGYIAFDLAPFSGSVTNARLRFHANLEKPGMAVVLVRSAVATNWVEKTLTWWESIPHAVTLGRAEVTAGSPSWYEVDVTQFIQQQLSNKGLWSNFALVYGSDSINRVQVRSRENKGFEPQLILSRGPFRAKVQFLPKGSVPAEGFFSENGTKFAVKDAGLSYGWNQDMTKHVRDRVSTNNAASVLKRVTKAPSRLHETFSYVDHPDIKTKALWEIAVPNGRYTVHVIAGDAGGNDGVYALNVEDKQVIDFIPESKKRWTEGTVTVDVKDGRLTLTDNPNGSRNKVCAIEITEVLN